MIQENFDGTERTDRELFRVGGIAAYIQLVCVTGTISVGMLQGGEPATPEEYFSVLSNDRLIGILRLDLFSLVNVMLFVVTSFAIYAASRRGKQLYPALFTAMIFFGFISEPVGIILLSIGGLFYLIWYPLLGIDLMKLASHPVQSG